MPLAHLVFQPFERLFHLFPRQGRRTGNRGAEVVEQSAGGCRWWRQVSAQRREGLPHPAAENVAEVAQLTLDLLDVRHLAGTEEIEVLQRVQLAGNDPAVV